MAIPEDGSIACHWIGVDPEKSPERAEIIAIAVESWRNAMLLNEFLSEFTAEERGGLDVRLDRDRNALFFDFATISDTIDCFHPILMKIWDAIGKNVELLNVADMAYFQANNGAYSEGYTLRWGDPCDLRYNWSDSSDNGSIQSMVNQFLAEVPESDRNIPGTIENKMLILDFPTQIKAISYAERNYGLILKAIEHNPDLLKLARTLRLQYAYGAAAFTIGL